MSPYLSTGEVMEPTYDVRFRARDPWPESRDDALNHVGVFQSYLEKVGTA
jgi:nitrile hydratase subunit beta